eukprot:10479314-Ditylum_brightwellii.AAC.1
MYQHHNEQQQQQTHLILTHSAQHNDDGDDNVLYGSNQDLSSINIVPETTTATASAKPPTPITTRTMIKRDTAVSLKLDK